MVKVLMTRLTSLCTDSAMASSSGRGRLESPQASSSTSLWGLSSEEEEQEEEEERDDDTPLLSHLYKELT